MNKKGKRLLLACCFVVASIIAITFINDAINNAIPLSQNYAYGANEIGFYENPEGVIIYAYGENEISFYENPEGVIIYCDESHAVSNSNDTINNAIPLSQNDAYGANEIGFYETPEGVIIYCDESHAVSNDLWSYSEGQFFFGISPEEFNSNPWSNKSMTIASNAEICKAECYDKDGNVIREENPVNNMVTIGSDCSKFILYVRYDDILYSAKFSRVLG